MARTYLQVPWDMAAHAKRHGAALDPERLQWYVAGAVPGELMNFVPQPQASVRLSGIYDFGKFAAWPGAERERKEPLPEALRLEIEETVLALVATFSDQVEAERWMVTRKVALRGRAPLEAMVTADGCRRVRDLLAHLRD